MESERVLWVFQSHFKQFYSILGGFQRRALQQIRKGFRKNFDSVLGSFIEFSAGSRGFYAGIFEGFGGSLVHYMRSEEVLEEF